MSDFWVVLIDRRGNYTPIREYYFKTEDSARVMYDKEKKHDNENRYTSIEKRLFQEEVDYRIKIK